MRGPSSPPAAAAAGTASAGPCRLQAAPLRDVATWIEHYRRFWEESFDRLDHYLRELQAKEKKRGRRKQDRRF